MVEQIERVVADAPIPAAWIVGPRSLMVDRAIPRLEFMWMPRTSQVGGTMRLARSPGGIAPERRQGWKAIAHRWIRKDHGLTAPTGPIIDLRGNAPGNWAHAQIFHLPFAQWASEWLGAKPTVLLPFGSPRFIRTLFGHFGFPVIATDRAVRGDIVMPTVSAPDAVRPERRTLVMPLVAELDRRRAAGELPADLPKKVFVVRAKTRRITNEAEIEAYLARDGYVKVLPERMTVPEQIELFNAATHVVAIHGAALAPMLFRSADAPPLDFVEVLTPGHMANSYRLMAAQIGARYVGVRGRMTPPMVVGAYRFDRFYSQHSLSHFAVDVESVKAARDIQANGAPPEKIA